MMGKLNVSQQAKAEEYLNRRGVKIKDIGRHIKEK